MSNPDKQLVSVRNHLSPLVRLRKGLIGVGLLLLAMVFLFGPRFEGDNLFFTILLLMVAFLAFGFGWVSASQGAMGWSRQVDFDFEKNEARQTSASILGRSKPFSIPFNKVANFVISEGPVAGEGGLGSEAMIELQDKNGRAIIKAGMFDNRAEAETVVQRISDAVAMAYQQNKPD